MFAAAEGVCVWPCFALVLRVTVPVPQAVNSRSDRLASKAVDPQENSAGSSPP